jgi:hypothetical protein
MFTFPGTAPRTELPEPGEVVAALIGCVRSEAVEGAHQISRLALGPGPDPGRTRCAPASVLLEENANSSKFFLITHLPQPIPVLYKS